MGLAIFFDIAVIVGNKLSRLDVYRFVPDILGRLKAGGGDDTSVSLSLMSNTGDETAARMNQLLAEGWLVIVCGFQSLCVQSGRGGSTSLSRPSFSPPPACRVAGGALPVCR
jgi:hypothetical protein